MSELIQDRAPAPGLAGHPAGPGQGPASPDAAAKARRGRSRFLLFAAAAIAGLVVGGVILFLRSSGGDVTAGDATGNPGASAPGASTGEPASGGTGEEAASGQPGDQATATPAPARSGRLSSRDPFAPLVPKRQPAADATPAPGQGGGDPTASPTAPAPSPAPTAGATLSALSVSPEGDSVQLKLNGKRYTVDEGETFAKSYRLYDIFNDSCAGFLYGDQNVVVCEGDSVTLGLT